MNLAINFSVPYVLICGNYKRNRIIDKLCFHLGDKLAEHKIRIISGGSKPGIKVSESMYKTLKELDEYEPGSIVTVFREKNYDAELKIKRIGCNLFAGNDIYEMRDYLISNSKALIIIGGAGKTKEEILLAQQQNLPIVPVGMSGGTAYNLWLHYFRNGKFRNEHSFIKLNNENPSIAADAVLSILKGLILEVAIDNSLYNFQNS